MKTLRETRFTGRIKTTYLLYTTIVIMIRILFNEMDFRRLSFVFVKTNTLLVQQWASV